jgi:enoyl-CoA hydratase/carnithine racemase
MATFGAGFMAALCHDVRIMRVDRVCGANEMQLAWRFRGRNWPSFAKPPMNAFFETVQLARRWTGPAALGVGIVQHVASAETLLNAAMQRAAELAPLGANRKVFGDQKETLYGENAVINGPHGPAYMLKHSADY